MAPEAPQPALRRFTFWQGITDQVIGQKEHPAQRRGGWRDHNRPRSAIDVAVVGPVTMT